MHDHATLLAGVRVPAQTAAEAAVAAAWAVALALRPTGAP
jgi:hypothetical protein